MVVVMVNQELDIQVAVVVQEDLEKVKVQLLLTQQVL